MSQTCIALPSLDDPSLNDPILTARLPGPNEQMYYRPRQLDPLPDINDPVILAQLNKTQCVPDTFQARTALLLPFERGLKLMRCKHGGFIFKYLDGNRRWRQAYPCNQKILCQECAMDQAIEQFDKYKSLIDFLPAQHFTRITIALGDATPGESFDQLMSFLDDTLPGLPVIAKVKPSIDTVEILYCGELSSAQAMAITAAYPAARSRRWHHTHFIRELHRVLDADIHSTPESAVHADAKYKDIRILRVHGLSQEERKKLGHIAPISLNFPAAAVNQSSEPGSQGGSDEYSPSQSPQSPSQPVEPASKTQSTTKNHYHLTASGHLMPLPPCPCGCGAAPISFASAKSKNDNSPDLKWIDINLVTKEESIN